MRKIAGHYGDLILGSKNQSCIGARVEHITGIKDIWSWLRKYFRKGKDLPIHRQRVSRLF